MNVVSDLTMGCCEYEILDEEHSTAILPSMSA